MAATVEQAVYERLAANEDLVALATVAPTLATQEADAAFVVFTVLGKDAPATITNGTGSLARYSVRVDSFAGTESLAAEIEQEVFSSLCPTNGWTDPAAVVQGCFLEDANTDVDPNGYFVRSQTFAVWFRPA